MGLAITGMHRSGTSAVARVVNAIGLSMGSGTQMPALSDNPRGYFERSDVAALNDEILGQFGAAWQAPPIEPIRADGLSETRLREARLGMDLLSAGVNDWFVKDPRLCLTLEVWDRLNLAALPLILVTREPAEVAASLKLRSGITHRRGLALWLRYHHAVAESSRRRDVLVLDYRSITEDPDSAMSALTDFIRPRVPAELELNRPPDPEQLVERSLRRNRSPELDRSLSTMLESATAVHWELQKLHGQQVDALPQFELPAWATEALHEIQDEHLTQQQIALNKRRIAELETRSELPGIGPVSVEELHNRMRIAEFESAKLEEDLVRVLRELGAIRASRAYRASRRAADLPIARRVRALRPPTT